MDTHAAWRAARLDPSGLVAFMACGHWWAYPIRGTAEQLHEIATFNRTLLCGPCLADWRADAYVPEPGAAKRVN
jgi:hypothetical protein